MNETLRVLVIGAHPDEPDIYAGGTAALYAKMGHKVKFLSLTNGEGGNYHLAGEELVRRRTEEAKKAAKALGFEEYEVLDCPDGQLLPTLQMRNEVIRQIRNWRADIVISFPEGCSHADNRYAGKIVSDASAFVALVPNVVPETPCLERAPLFLLMPDYSTRGEYRPDIVVDTGEVIEEKLLACDAHASQFYEYAPWANGILSDVPSDWAGKREFLLREWSPFFHISDEMRAPLSDRYGEERAEGIAYAEPFEIAPYNTRAIDRDIRALFPMFPDEG